MAFLEAFIDCLQQSGVSGGGGLPDDQNQIAQIVNDVGNAFNNLGSGEKAAFDLIAGQWNIGDLAHYLGVSGVEPLADILTQSNGWDLGSVIQYCQHCIEQASQQAQEV